MNSSLNTRPQYLISSMVIGMRPVIVKVKDPNKVIRDGIEQPNAGYYR